MRGLERERERESQIQRVILIRLEIGLERQVFRGIREREGKEGMVRKRQGKRVGKKA